MDRRRFISLAELGVVALWARCANETSKVSTPIATLTPRPILTSTPRANLPPEVQTDVAKYYAPLQNFPLSAYGEFDSAGGSVRWRNFSSWIFHPDRAKTYYDYLTALAKNPPIKEVEIGGQRVTMTVKLYDRMNRFLYITPQNAPPPPWPNLPPEFRDVGAATRDVPTESTMVSVIQYYPVPPGGFRTYDEELAFDNNIGIYTETCQSVAQGGAINFSARAAQEHFCNSLGIAVYERVRTSTYPNYISRMSQASLEGGTPNLPSLNRPIIFTEKEFNDIPSMGPILTPT